MKDYDSKKERSSARDKPRKRMLESSSDCSFLERAAASDPRPETLDTHKLVEGIEIQEESKTRRQSRKLERSVSLDGSVVSLSITQQVETFEKRERHKTREDRYEPKKTLVDPKSKVNKEKKRENKGKIKPRGKGFKNTGGDLMQQFSSKSVGHDRLTVRALKTILCGALLIIGRCVHLTQLAYSKMAERLLLGDDGDVRNVCLGFFVLLTPFPQCQTSYSQKWSSSDVQSRVQLEWTRGSPYPNHRKRKSGGLSDCRMKSLNTSIQVLKCMSKSRRLIGNRPTLLPTLITKFAKEK